MSNLREAQDEHKKTLKGGWTVSYSSFAFETSNLREAQDEHLCQKGINVSTPRGTWTPNPLIKSQCG